MANDNDTFPPASKRILDLWLSGAVSSQAGAVRHYHPELNDTTIKARAHRLFNSEPAKQYIAQQTARTSEKAEAMKRAALTALQWRALGIAPLITAGIVEAVMVPSDKPGRQDRVFAIAEGRVIPSEALGMIEGLEPITDANGQSRVMVIPAEISDRSQDKASELLLRALGAFVDRQEISGPNGAPLATVAITEGMTQMEAAEIYRRFIRGQA